MKITNQKDFATGIAYVLVGLAAAIGATRYQLGTAARMGPGFFPFLAGMLLAFTGAIVAFGAVSRHARPNRFTAWDWKVIWIVLTAVVMFGLTIEPFGLVVALPLLIGVSAFAHPASTLRATLAMILVLVPLVWLVFVQFLGLRLAFFPSVVN